MVTQLEISTNIDNVPSQGIIVKNIITNLTKITYNASIITPLVA